MSIENQFKCNFQELGLSIGLTVGVTVICYVANSLHGISKSLLVSGYIFPVIITLMPLFKGYKGNNSYLFRVFLASVGIIVAFAGALLFYLVVP